MFNATKEVASPTWEVLKSWVYHTPMEIETFCRFNKWFDGSSSNIVLKPGIIIDKNVEFIKTYDLALDTDGEERRLKWSTMKKLMNMVPESVCYKDTFLFSKKAMTFENINLNDNDYIGLFNLTARNVVRSVRSDHENYSKLMNFIELLRNKNIIVRRLTKTELTIPTGSEPTQTLVIADPPSKCDVLVCRSSQVCAMPDALLQKLCSHTIIHYGKLSRPLPFPTLDACSFTSNGFSDWVKDLNEVILQPSSLSCHGAQPEFHPRML